MIKRESFRAGLTVPTEWGPVPVSASRIMYLSTDANGAKVAVTGTYLEPSRAWTGIGPRPVVIYGPGAHGSGDQCAPSILTESVLTLGLPGGPMAEIEDVATYNIVAKGYSVVSTDYMGLGTPGMHSAGNRLDLAHAMLDAARAATTLPNVDRHAPIALLGYSQGGEAASAAAEELGTYAPELNIAGIYAGGIPTDMRSLLHSMDGSKLSVAIMYELNGLMARYPEFAAKVTPYLNDAGLSMLKKVGGSCILLGTLLVGTTPTSAWTKSGKPMWQVVDNDPVLARIIDDQRIGDRRPSNVAILISNNPEDPTVPPQLVSRLYSDWCAMSPQSVEFRTIKFPLPYVGGSAAGHIAGALPALAQAFDWLRDRFNGVRPVSGCVHR